MSDYLWDRTGERDAEVERLEALLGAFAHEARPLELPAENFPPLPAENFPHAAPRRFGFAERLFASRRFAPAGLAAAAALALVLFGAAAWLLRARPGHDGGRPAARSHEAAQSGVTPKSSESESLESKSSEPESSEPARRESGAGHAPESAARVKAVKSGAFEKKAGGTKGEGRAVEDERRAVESLARGPLRRKGPEAAAPPWRENGARVARDGGGAAEEVFTFEAMRSGGGASALVENTRLLTKERLVYALRLTGAKLRDVRQKAQGLDGPDSRPR